MKTPVTIGLILLLGSVAGCATATGPDGSKRYGFELPDMLEAVERGEGREALAFYEQEAVDLERRGHKLEAVKAHRAAAFVAPRVGAYQKSIRAGLRGLELLKQEHQTQEILALQLSLYVTLGGSYRRVGDLREARRYFEEGLEIARSFPKVRRGLTWTASLSRSLAGVAYSQGDYWIALEQGLEAIRLLEDRLRVTRPGRIRFNTRRHLAQTYILVATVQHHRGSLDEAETYSLRTLEIAKELHLQEIEAQAIAGLGEEALAAFGRSIELVEDVRNELQEAGLRSGFLEDKQGIYHRAVRSALALGKPEEAFGYAERGRARAFLDLLGNETTLSRGKTRALVEEEVRLRARLQEARALAEEDEASLQRAFLYAGTPAVVTTLWKVDDRASFILMREFYDQLAQGRGPAEALRRAQGAAMKEFPHPFAWAAFGLTGAPR